MNNNNNQPQRKNKAPTHRRHPRRSRRRDSAVAAAQQLEKLVQTVQRQFVIKSSSSSSSNNNNNNDKNNVQQLQLQPHSAAAAALGRQIGTTLITFLSACLDDEKLIYVRDDLVLRHVLCNSSSSSSSIPQTSQQVHPSIPHAILETVLEAYSYSCEEEQNDASPTTGGSSSSSDFEVLDWLPDWILQVEKCLVEQHHTLSSSSSSSVSSLMETLSATMRAYALALQADVLHQVQEQEENYDNHDDDRQHLENEPNDGQVDNDDEQMHDHDDDNNNNNNNNITASKRLLELHGKLQLVSSRMALVRHIIPLLVMTPTTTTSLSTSTKPSTTTSTRRRLFRYIVPILSPLLTSTVLHLDREMHEKWAALQVFWRATDKVIAEVAAVSSLSSQNGHSAATLMQHYYALDLMHFMTHQLDWFLWGLVNNTTTSTSSIGGGSNNAVDQLHQSLELAQTWWVQLTGVMAPALFYTIQNRSRLQERQQQDDDNSCLILFYGRFQDWVACLLRDTLPRLVQSAVAVQKSCCPSLVLSVQALLEDRFSLLLEDMCDLSSSSSAAAAMTTSTGSIRHRRTGGSSSATMINSHIPLLDDPVLVFHWATLILTSPRGEDRRALLETIVSLLKQQQQHFNSSGSRTNNNKQQLLHAVALVNLHDEACREAAAKVIWLLQQQETKESLLSLEPAISMLHKGNSNGFHIMHQLLQGSSSSSSSPLICMAAKYSLPLPETEGGTMVLDGGSYLSPSQQAGALLFGLALLQQQDEHNHGDDESNNRRGYNFLQRLLARYPHLGISLLPIFMDRLNQASRLGNGRGVIRELEFVCQHLVTDPHCAQEVWNLVGHELVVKTYVAPLQVRVLLIRLFPQLLSANKRLYRRVIETLSHVMSTASSVQINKDKEQEQVEIRLAVAATIADLAKDDDVRDVSDVIAIIQRLLTQDTMVGMSSSSTATTSSLSNDTPEQHQAAILLDSNPMQSLQVHYAILSLHYLVVAQELDFEVVLKVLNKRLCPLTNMEQILQLPPVVLESLVLLLGDGECHDDHSSGSNDDDDEDDNGGSKKKQMGISPQVSRAVETLLQLASAMVDRIITQCNQDGDNRTNFRVLSNILRSLGQYSMTALGLDDELIKEVAGKPPPETAAQSGIKSDNRYVVLRQLVADALEELPKNVEKDDQTQDSLVALLRNLLKFEQETLGSSLWEKRGKRQLQPGDSAIIPRGRLSALPSPSSVRERANKGNQNSPSIACAMLFASEYEGFELLSHFRDESDACIESTDPASLVFAVQAYLTTAARVVGTVSEQEIGQVLIDVGAWCKVYTTRDAMYLALAAISLYIPHALRESESSEQTYAQEIRGVITTAYKNQRFQKDDVSKICLGLVGAASLREGVFDAVQDIFTFLEQSVRGYCGQQSFGAYYGLALIGQMLPKCLGSSPTSSSSSRATPATNTCDERIFSLLAKISGFLVEELLSCFEHGGPSFRNLVVCFKSGIVTSDLISAIRQIEPGSIPLLETKQVAAKCLFISCALCLPSLCAINGQLLLAALRLFEVFSWGCGKGVAVPSIIRACLTAGLLRQGEMEQIHSDCTSLFETHMEGAVPEVRWSTLEDLFIAALGTSESPKPKLVRSILFSDDVCFSDDSCALALLASATTICTIPCFGGDLFPLPARLKPSTQADIKSIVDIVCTVVDMGDDSKCSHMGIVLLGLLSSLRNHSATIAVDHCLPRTDKPQSTELSGMHTATSQVDFSTLPCPKTQTILSVVTDAIARSVVHGSPSGIQSASFTRLLESLEVVVLPDQFSTGFLGPVIHQLPDEYKPALVNLLLSQARGRRPATMGGTGFIQLALQISLAIDADWKSTLGGDKAVYSFVKYMEFFLPKYPIDTLKDVLVNVWHHSFAAGKPVIITFLAASERLLEGDRLTDNGKDIYGTLLVGQIIRDLQTFPFDVVMDRDGGVLLEEFTRCLSHLPLSLLEREGFFKYDESEPAMDDEVLRVTCSTELIRLGFFKAIKSEVHQRSRISAWISRRLVVPLDDESLGVLRRLIVCLVEAVNKERPTVNNKPDQLAELLEILLLSRGSRIGLEWLAIAMSIWCGAQGSDADLSLGYLFTSDLRSLHGQSDLCQIMLHDLPFNVGTFCRKEKVAAIVFNLLHRLFMRWSEEDEYAVEPEALDCLRRTLISCRPGLAKEDVFVSVACDALSSATLTC